MSTFLSIGIINILLLAVCGCISEQPIPNKSQTGLRTGELSGSFAELLILRSACRLKNYRTLQASSYDRQGGFFDAGHFIRTEQGRRYVIMEENNPGCIDRIWLTRKTLNEPYDLLIYLDGSKEPIIHISLAEWSSGNKPPFVRPLAGTCADEKHPAYFSYVPIGFQRSCKIVLVPTAPDDKYEHRKTETGKEIPLVFYQITYRKFQPGTLVKRFQWNLEETEKDAFDKVRVQWANAGV